MNAERDRDRLAEQLSSLPAEAWDRPVPPPPPAVYEDEPRRLRVRPLVAAAAAAALLGLGVATGLLVAGGGAERSPSAPAGRAVALGPLGSAPLQASGRARVSADRATVGVTGLRPSRAGQFYELWLIGEGDRLVSLGSFRVPASGVATLTTRVPVDRGRFRTVDVSVEKADGDPGHSGVSVLRGRT